MPVLYVAVIIFATALPSGDKIMYGPNFPDQALCFEQAKVKGYPWLAKQHFPDHKIYCVNEKDLTEEQRENAGKILVSELRSEDYVPPE
jgi:hypothetical protein